MLWSTISYQFTTSTCPLSTRCTVCVSSDQMRICVSAPQDTKNCSFVVYCTLRTSPLCPFMLRTKVPSRGSQIWQKHFRNEHTSDAIAHTLIRLSPPAVTNLVSEGENAKSFTAP